MREWITAVAAALLIVLGVLMSALLVMDAQAAKADPETYRLVHHVPADQYVARNHRFVVGLVAVAALGLLRFADRKRKAFWGGVSVFVLAVSLIVIVVGYAQWAATGFDH